MKYLRYLTLFSLLMLLPLAYAQAQVRVGVGIGVGPGYVAGPPVCSYGYYDYYPYACAPYGYYGPEWFTGGVFIGAGPWYHGWGRPYWDHGVYHPGFYGHGYVGRGFEGRGPVGRGYAGRGFAGRGYEGRAPAAIAHGGGGFRGGAGSHGGGGFQAEAVTAAKRLSSQAVMTAGSEAAGRFFLRRSRLIRNGRE